MTTYAEIWQTLSTIDCTKHIEKKGGLDYLSWANAWALLMAHYPQAQFQFNPEPRPGMVECRVTIDECEREMELPIMDHRNMPVDQPTPRDINDNQMRCLVKTLALFGLGISLYRGLGGAGSEPDKSVKDRYKAYGEALRTNWLEVVEVKGHLADWLFTGAPESLVGAVECHEDLNEDAQKVLQLAATAGGILTPKERGVLKSNEWNATRNEVYGK